MCPLKRLVSDRKCRKQPTRTVGTQRKDSVEKDKRGFTLCAFNVDMKSNRIMVMVEGRRLRTTHGARGGVEVRSEDLSEIGHRLLLLNPGTATGGSSGAVSVLGWGGETEENS